jgi:hypothetical protein
MRATTSVIRGAVLCALLTAVGFTAASAASAPATLSGLRTTAAATAPAPPPPPISHPVSFNVGGANGSGDAFASSLPCPGSTAPVSYWHMGYETALAPGTFGIDPAELRMRLDVRTDRAGQAGANAWLQGSESTVTIANPRGSIELRLVDGGGCGTPTASIASASVATHGSWTVGGGTGAYAGVTGLGSFTLAAGLAPGAANPWTLTLGGALNIQAPDLAVTASTYWGGVLGIDFLSRRVTVVYQVKNNGPGYAYGLGLSALSSPTPGVTLSGGVPAVVNDLRPGATATFVVRWQFAPIQPCLIPLGCPFDTKVTLAATDALNPPITSPPPTLHLVSPILPLVIG